MSIIAAGGACLQSSEKETRRRGLDSVDSLEGGLRMDLTGLDWRPDLGASTSRGEAPGAPGSAEGIVVTCNGLDTGAADSLPLPSWATRSGKRGGFRATLRSASSVAMLKVLCPIRDEGP